MVARAGLRPWVRSGRFTRALLAGLLAVPLVVLGGARSAAAYDMTTNYPAVRVGPGERTEMKLDISSDTIQRVNLSVVSVPNGWDARLTGGGFEIHAVYTRPGTNPDVTLEVRVPDDAPEGPHQVLVRAESGGQVVEMPVIFDVADDVTGAFELTAQFAQLQGKPTDTFNFDVTLNNNSPRQVAFALSVDGPPNWSLTAQPSASTQASTITVEGGESGSIRVSANPPDDVPAGTYDLVLHATGAGSTLDLPLQVTVQGTVDLELTTADGRLNAKGHAGKTSAIPLVVRNKGSAPLQGLTLSASSPSGWDVTFEPSSSISVVGPGETVNVTARVRPDGDSVAGDYDLTIRGSGGGENASVAVRYAVETSSWWGVIGVIVIALAVVVLLGVFRRFGRR